jgi:hypothetical protein
MLFTNHRKDTIRGAFHTYTAKHCEVSLACPFFSYETAIEEIHKQNCKTRLIVRLCSATNPVALGKAMSGGTKIRFFTSQRFHSKLYVFGDQIALVGSANMTDAGMQSNQEIVIGVLPDDPRFEELVRLFQSYWNDAEPLDEARLKEYAAIFQSNKREQDPIDAKIKSTFGDVTPSGIQVGGPKKTSEAIYLDGYRRTYQEFLYSFRTVEKLYKEVGRRKLPESVVPLRIEIDSFFSYVREKFTSGDSYLESEKLSGELLENNVREKIRSWHQTEWPYLQEKIPENYARIIGVLGLEEKLKSSSYEEIVDALTVCHAFHEQLRFFNGGLPTVQKEFMADNSESRVKSSLSHLLFGSGDFVTRMGECIFDPNFSLHHFGRSCVQELYGWIKCGSAGL